MSAATMNFKQLCEALEAERSDLSYLRTPRKPEINVVTKVVRVVPEKLKGMYFHAGRYSAGDRDSSATEAWSQYELKEKL
jgi:tRNA(Glu) U13 pseudouridine synthase TruD